VLFCHCRMGLSSAQLDSKLESSLFLNVLLHSGMWNLLCIVHSNLGGKPAFSNFLKKTCFLEIIQKMHFSNFPNKRFLT
jgi:hypothetical protein